MDTKSKTVDESTFDYKKMTDNIDECVDDLIKLFSKKSDLTLEQIIAEPFLKNILVTPNCIFSSYRIISDEIPLLCHKNR